MPHAPPSSVAIEVAVAALVEAQGRWIAGDVIIELAARFGLEIPTTDTVATLRAGIDMFDELAASFQMERDTATRERDSLYAIGWEATVEYLNVKRAHAALIGEIHRLDGYFKDHARERDEAIAARNDTAARAQAMERERDEARRQLAASEEQRLALAREGDQARATIADQGARLHEALHARDEARIDRAAAEESCDRMGQRIRELESLPAVAAATVRLFDEAKTVDDHCAGECGERESECACGEDVELELVAAPDELPVVLARIDSVATIAAPRPGQSLRRMPPAPSMSLGPAFVDTLPVEIKRLHRRAP